MQVVGSLIPHIQHTTKSRSAYITSNALQQLKQPWLASRSSTRSWPPLPSSALALRPDPRLAPTPALPVNLDKEGKPIQFINSVIGDDEDEDYTPAELEQRSLLRRGKEDDKDSSHESSALSRKLSTHDHEKDDKSWSGNFKVTWNFSPDFLSPQCGDDGEKWHPKDSSHVGTVMKKWDDGPKCGEFVKLCYGYHNHCVVVRVFNTCTECTEDHINLSKSAFKKLSPSGTLKEGSLDGLKMYKTKQPSPWDLGAFWAFEAVRIDRDDG
ncbi:hypothetical protein NDA18_003448 [Ustilago nuda]|nr:hypothetical protein NDA18_003448 [Ustilago nuda]